eukprot:11155332-Lingulodinium_polyedra.AAC.1
MRRTRRSMRSSPARGARNKFQTPKPTSTVRWPKERGYERLKTAGSPCTPVAQHQAQTVRA